MPPDHSDLLPIITPDPEPPRRSQAERFGGLFYLGIGGLVVLLALIGWFGWRVWSLRPVWQNVYILNDPSRPEIDRLNAALALARDPEFNDRQRWDLALSRIPPPLARYLLAESLTAEAIAADPSGYALAVARSEGWPDWLRLLLVRPLALDDGRLGLPRDPLAELRAHPDPAIALWAAYVQAVAREDPEAALALESAPREGGPFADLARLLRAAFRTGGARRRDFLDEATLWQRRHHPDSARLWAGWEERDGRIVPRDPDPTARDLQPESDDNAAPGRGADPATAGMRPSDEEPTP
jgi:hypothetical protein